MADFNGAEVYTLEGKKVGKVTEVDSSYFTVYKQGLVTDEEFSIPLSSISAVENENRIVRINMNEDQLKHGFEFARAKPNSDFVSGISESEAKIPNDKPLIHYESIQALEQGRPAIKPHPTPEYVCDMCNARFGDSSALSEHRLKQHKAPIGI